MDGCHMGHGALALRVNISRLCATCHPLEVSLVWDVIQSTEMMAAGMKGDRICMGPNSEGRTHAGSKTPCRGFIKNIAE
jgi:hypothetical protein